MRKNLVFMLLCAAMFICSCSDKMEDTTANELVDVVFTLDAEKTLTTRAISDGTGANQLMYGVFNDKKELIISKAVKNDVSGLTSNDGYSMTLSLAKGHYYQVVFWAQNSNCNAYTVSDDMKVSINYNGLNNDENRDAFFSATEIFKVESSTTISVTLKRPFAQVNVGAFPFDLEYVKEMGIDIQKSSATMHGVANQLNLLDGEIDGEVDVTYSLNTIPNEKLYVDVDSNNTKESYEWLSMSYILANTKSIHAMSFTFSNEDSTSIIEFHEGLEFVPIQRNYRTNIVGQILSGTTSFNIKIDPIYESENINSAGLYYNFSENTTIMDKIFAFNTTAAATFTSENNNLITMQNVTFSGNVEQIAMGEYRDKGNYVSFTNELKNVTAKDMVVTHPIGIANVEPIDYMAPLIFLRGENKVTDCTFTGATTIAADRKDYNGDYHKVVAYDCGVPNACSAVFENCEIGKLYAWSHSQITLKNTKVDYIRCSTHKWSNSAAHLTIDSGTEVNEISISSSGLAKFVTINGKKTLTAELWAPSLIIKAGAKVKRLDMNGRLPYKDYNDNDGNLDRRLSVIIEDGAIIEEIVNAADDIPNAPKTSKS